MKYNEAFRLLARPDDDGRMGRAIIYKDGEAQQDAG